MFSFPRLTFHTTRSLFMRQFMRSIGSSGTFMKNYFAPANLYEDPGLPKYSHWISFQLPFPEINMYESLTLSTTCFSLLWAPSMLLTPTLSKYGACTPTIWELFPTVTDLIVGQMQNCKYTEVFNLRQRAILNKIWSIFPVQLSFVSIHFLFCSKSAKDFFNLIFAHTVSRLKEQLFDNLII